MRVPIAWFPRLAAGSPEQRQRWRPIGRGVGIRWEELDEDLSVEGLLRAWDAEPLALVAGTEVDRVDGLPAVIC